MKGLDELISAIKAAYPFFYVETQEVNKTTKDIQDGLKNYFEINKNGNDYPINVWDYEYTDPKTNESKYSNPDDMLILLENIQDGTDSIPINTIIIAKCYNWFLTDQYGECEKGKTAWLLNRSSKFSSTEYRKILIIVGNIPFDKAIPEILKRDFAKIEFDLPDEKEIEKIYNFTIDSVKDNPKFKQPTEKNKQRIISGAKGLTYSEIIKVFSYTLVKNKGIFDPKTVEELRAEEINSTPGLTIGNYNKNLDDLKGYEVAKEIVDEFIDDPLSKGLLLLGPAGVGKTHFCQALSTKHNRLIIELEFAQVMGDGLVGQAEKAMKKALDVITANANPISPIILFIDEIEKGLAGTSGAGSSGTRDGGTTDRSNAQFLKFLSDRPAGIYVVASCNDIEKLPAAYVRTGRWDIAPIFIDLPNKEEKTSILKHYQKVYNVDTSPSNMDSWTGAEIKAWCILAAKKISKGKPPNDADDFILPIAKTMNQEIDYLREWSKGRAVSASRKMVVSPQTVSNRKLDI